MTKHPLVLKLIRMILLVGTLICALFALQIFLSETLTQVTWEINPHYFMALSLFTQALLFVICVFPRRHIVLRITDAISMFICLAASIVLVIMVNNPTIQYVVSIVFIGTYLLRRIPLFFVIRSKRNIILNALITLFLALTTYVFVASGLKAKPIFIYSISVIVFSVLEIITIAFSGFRLPILMKILKKTYAAEITLGLICLIVAFSFIFYYMDSGFNTYFDAIWYCFAVVTTIGFGDYTTTSITGRILSIILGIYGIIFVALVTSIIVNFYTEVKDHAESDSESAEIGLLKEDNQEKEAAEEEKKEEEKPAPEPEPAPVEEVKPEVKTTPIKEAKVEKEPKPVKHEKPVEKPKKETKPEVVKPVKPIEAPKKTKSVEPEPKPAAATTSPKDERVAESNKPLSVLFNIYDK